MVILTPLSPRNAVPCRNDVAPHRNGAIRLPNARNPSHRKSIQNRRSQPQAVRINVRMHGDMLVCTITTSSGMYSCGTKVAQHREQPRPDKCDMMDAIWAN